MGMIGSVIGCLGCFTLARQLWKGAKKVQNEPNKQKQLLAVLENNRRKLSSKQKDKCIHRFTLFARSLAAFLLVAGIAFGIHLISLLIK